jgi:hypothetical protein
MIKFIVFDFRKQLRMTSALMINEFIISSRLILTVVMTANKSFCMNESVRQKSVPFKSGELTVAEITSH